MLEHCKFTQAANKTVGVWTYFSYGKNICPHAVMEVENTDGKIPGDALTTSFNDFGKIQLIVDAGKRLRMDFTYGPDQERWYSELSKNGTDVSTTVYAGEYEKITENGVTREFYYPDGNTIAIRENGSVKVYLAFTDNLGSILSVIDEDGTKVFDATYDAWCRQTVTLNTIGLHRGYTGHEMLAEFDIINMNGRLYDPETGRFLSPDNFVQMPDFSQSFNRYSYCVNNPLKYSDPSGQFWHLVIGAVVGGILNWATNGAKFDSKGLAYFGIGAISGAISAGIGAGVSSAMAGGSFWAGALGTAGAKTLTSSFISGAITGSITGGSAGIIAGTGNALLANKSFGEVVSSGLLSGLIGSASGGLLGGIISGVDALLDSRTFFTGKYQAFIDIRSQIPITKQIGKYDCVYGCMESIDMYFNGVARPQEYFRSLERGGEFGLLDIEIHRLISKAGYRFLTYYNLEKTPNFLKIADIISSMRENKIVLLNLNTESGISGNSTGNGFKFGHVVIVKRAALYRNGSVVLNVMDPAGKISKITNFDRFFDIYEIFKY